MGKRGEGQRIVKKLKYLAALMQSKYVFLGSQEPRHRVCSVCVCVCVCVCV
jgi:hypothetical protein